MKMFEKSCRFLVCIALIGACVIALATSSLLAQSAPAVKTSGTEYNSRFDFATLYSYFQAHGADTNVGISYNDIRLGEYASGSYYFNRRLGLEAAFESHPDGDNDGLYDVQAGPIARFNMDRISLFAHGLVGMSRLAGPNTRFCCYIGYTYHNPWTWGGPSYTAGGGLDINLSRVISLRLIQVDYTYNNVSFGPPTGGFGVYKNENPLGGRAHLPGLQASAGLVWHFGDITPPPAVTYSCSANPTTVFPGDPITITGVAMNLNPKKTATYTWTSAAGPVNGSGSTVTVSNKTAGSYTVNGHVTEGPKVGQSADCSASYTAQDFAPPTISCSANPSTVNTGDPSLLLLVAPGVLPLRAQKWIAPTPEELSMTEQKGAPGADAVFFFHEEITDDDNLTFTFHNRIKILKPGGEDLARVVLDSVLPTNGNDDTIRSFAGRTIHSDGTVISMTQAPDQKVSTGPNGKTIQKTYQLPQPEVGSILEYRYTIHLENHLEPPTWLLQRKYYVRRAHYEWLPTNGRLAIHPKGEPSQAIQSIAYTPILPPGVQVMKGIAQDNTNRVLFELNATDIPALPSEDLMPPVSSFGYRVRFYYLTASSNEEFWRQTGKLFSDDWDRYAGPGDNIKRLVASLVAPSDTPEQKLRKLYAAVMQIDNLSVDRDQGSPPAQQQYPKSADEVLTMSRGNNDQITLLFVAMVRAAGMTAYVMRVSNRDEYIFDPSDPNVGQLDDNIAIVELGGKELFLDPGTRFCPFGHLFWRHAATTGLRQTKGGTEIAETPLEPLEANQVQRVANLTIDREAEATGTLKVTLLGTAAIDLRQAAAIDQLAFRKKLKEAWEKVFPKGMEIEVSSIDKLKQFDEPLTIVATVKGPIGMTEGGRILVAADLFEARSDQLFQPESRLEPIHFRVREIVRDVIRITFPASMRVVSLPAGSTEKLNGVPSYEFSSESTATYVTIRRNYAIGLIYPASDYPQLRSVFSSLQTKDREPIIFAGK